MVLPILAACCTNLNLFRLLSYDNTIPSYTDGLVAIPTISSRYLRLTSPPPPCVLTICLRTSSSFLNLAISDSVVFSSILILAFNYFLTELLFR